MSFSWPRRAALSIGVALAACAVQSTGPVDADPLAAAFDDLTRAANREGDVDAGAAFSAAAMAVRRGVEAVPLAVTLDGVSTPLAGFVHEVTVSRTGAPPLALRTLVLVDRVDRPEQVLYVAALADSGDLVRPTEVLSNRAGRSELAWASWRDLVTGAVWVGTSGSAGMTKTSTGDPCPSRRAPSQVLCVTATFDGFLTGELHRLGPGGMPVSADRRDVRLRATAFPGAVLSVPAP